MKKHFPLLFPSFLVITSFIVYWLTKPPSILWIDSGTMIAASASLGIPNPPGFPFYMMASHLFTLIPFANVLTRLELFTILFSLWLLFLVYKTILLLIQNDFFFAKPSNLSPSGLKINHLPYIVAAFGTIALAFSYQYWSQSQNTEAFIFSYSFVALFSYLILKAEAKKKELTQAKESKKFPAYLFKTLLAIAFLYGLAAGANPTVGSLVPGVLFFMFLNRKYLNLQKLFILGLTFAITISAVYSYLPIRASQWPFVNWGNPQTVKLFIDHLHGAGLNINEPGPYGSINGFTGSPLVFTQSVSYFVLSSLYQFTPILWPLIILGMIYVIRKNRVLFAFLMSVPAIDVIYSGLYLSGNQESWFILSWIFFSIFLAIGFLHLVNIINKPKALLFFPLCLLPLIVFFIPLNRSNHYYSADFAYNLYTPLEKDAIIIGTGDFFDALSHYLHVADIYRPDVTPITANVFYVNRWNRDTIRHTTDLSVSDKLESMIQYKTLSEYNEVMNQLIDENIDKHPIYVNHLTLRASALAGTNAGQLRLDSRFKFIPNGLSLRVVRANDNFSPDPKSYDFKFRTPLTKKPFYLERNYKGAFGNILNDYIYGWEALGDWYADKQKDDLALRYYETARQLSEKNSEIYAHLGEFYARRGDFNASYQYLEKAERLDVNNPAIHFNLGLAYNNLNKIYEAKLEFESVKRLVGEKDPLFEESDKILKQLNAVNINDEYSTSQTANWTKITDEKNNIYMKIPPDFTKGNPGDSGSFLITDNNPGALGLNIEVFGTKIQENENLEEFIKKSPLTMIGILLDTQPVKLQGFGAWVQIYGTSQGDSSQRFILTKNNWVWQFKVYPGNSSKTNTIYQVLGTFEPLKR